MSGMVTVQAIRMTPHPADWQRLAVDLGLAAAAPPAPEWAEFDGDGILAVHAAEAASDQLHLLVDDLPGAVSAVRAAGFVVQESEMADVGPMATVSPTTGPTLTLSTGARLAQTGPLTVQPIWYGTDPAEAARLLTALGLTTRIASDSGVWTEFAASGGGSVAFHRAEHIGLTLAMTYSGGIDVLATRLQDAGHEATVVDEAYNRTLLVTAPDLTLWINGPYEDMYGYRRVG